MKSLPRFRFHYASRLNSGVMRHIADFFARLIQWPGRASTWLLQARLAVFAISVVVLCCIFSLYYRQTEQAVRLSGLALQLLGIAAAAIGIRDTRRKFGKPSFLELVRGWIKRIPGLAPHVVSVSGSSTVSISSSAHGNIWHGVGPDPTLESRLATAEANLRLLRDRADATESVVEANERLTVLRLRDEKEARAEADRQLHLKIESASTDGLHLAAVGVLWLASGVILSTAPVELLCLLG